jgi:peptidoglycan/LPS O-acetylase OafA/YrhL
MPLIQASRALGEYLHPANRGVVTLVASFVAVLISIGVASLSWEYFEKPLVKRGHRWRYTQR